MDPDAFLEGIPSEAFSDWTSLLGEAPTPVEDLRVELAFYLDHVREEGAKEGSQASVHIAEAIAAACEALLDHVADDDTRGRKLSQAALRYFTVEDDGEGDLASADGFADAAEVINAVLTELGLPIEVPLANPS